MFLVVKKIISCGLFLGLTSAKVTECDHTILELSAWVIAELLNQVS